MIYRCRNLTLDTDLYRLSTGDKQIDVEPQVFDILVYLIENRDRVVSRGELLDTLWKGRVVTDSALSARLKAARKAVGDTGNAQNIIKTIHGRGYQFIADIVESETSGLCSTSAVQDAKSQPSARQDRPSIVVLPFRNMSNDAEQEYFSDGITEDIITELSRFHDLFVIARNSSFFYKGKTVKVEDIGRDLGVAYVVEGSVRKDGGRARITAQLVETESGKHLWAERFDRDLKDVFTVQDEITHLVASMVGARVESVDRQRALALSADGLEAYDLYLRAKAHALEFKRTQVAEAKWMLDQSIQLNPRNAQVHALLATCCLQEWLSWWVDDREANLDLALAHARRAVQLDGSNSRTRWSLGEVLQYLREFDEAQLQLETAVDLNPNDVEALCIYGYFLACAGEAEKGIKLFDLAARLDPFDLNWRQWLHGDALFIARRYEESIVNLNQVKGLNPEVLFKLALNYAQLQRNDEAKQHLQAFLSFTEQDMVNFPGRELEAWRPFCGDECKDQKDTDHIFQSLAKAWSLLEA